jgi:hypothetical protein
MTKIKDILVEVLFDGVVTDRDRDKHRQTRDRNTEM